MHDAWQISAEDAEEYTKALGQIMAGGWRQIALAQRLGVPAALGMTTDVWVRERIGGFIRMGLDERREAARELTDPNGDFQMTQRQAAEVLGIGQSTLSRALRDDPDASSVGSSPGGADDLTDPDASPDDWDDDRVMPDPLARANAGLISFEPNPDGSYDLTAALDDEDDAARPEDEPELTATGGTSQPTMGEIMGPAFVIDDTGLASEREAQKRYRYATGVLDSLYAMTLTHPPEVLVEGESTERLPTRARLLEFVIDWLARASALANSPQTQIRRVP